MIVVSSANKTNWSTLVVCMISFTYNMNNNGPKIDPCGTSHVIFLYFDLDEL